MNKCKNAHYKSAVQLYNSAEQLIPITALATNPLTLALGARVTDTGCAIDINANSLSIEQSGLYEISADINVTGTVAGDVTFALIVDGVILPETIRTVTLVAGASQVVPIETVKRFATCCAQEDRNISVIAYSDGTATGTVIRVSTKAVKLA